mmetsp:Transcript_69237/g.144603  ORF Transcript_69237/g.144603 Transcript_69237/m.144603 type:complete len:101 (-) Transcript_69237:3-305(-)
MVPGILKLVHLLDALAALCCMHRETCSRALMVDEGADLVGNSSRNNVGESRVRNLREPQGLHQTMRIVDMLGMEDDGDDMMMMVMCNTTYNIMNNKCGKY